MVDVQYFDVRISIVFWILLAGLKRFTKYFNYPNTIELKRQVAKVLQSENKYPF